MTLPHVRGFESNLLYLYHLIRYTKTSSANCFVYIYIYLQFISGANGYNFGYLLIFIISEMMVFDWNVMCSWRKLLSLRNSNATFVISKQFALNLRCRTVNWENTAYFSQKLDQWNYCFHSLAECNILQFNLRYGYLRLKFTLPYDWISSIEYGITSSG